MGQKIFRYTIYHHM